MLLGVLRVHDDETHHAHRHLYHLIGMGMIFKGAGFLHRKFVHVGLARWNLRLIQAAHPVHAVRQQDAVPVHRGVLRQFVRHEDAYFVAFDTFDGRPWALAVVAPKIGLHPGRYLAHHRLGDKMKFLPAVLHAPRQCPTIQGDDRVIGPAIRRREWRLGRRIILQRCFG